MRIISFRKGEISTPIVAILVTVAALAVTGVAVAWMTKIGFSASQQGILTVIGTSTISEDDNYLYITFTVKNLGNRNATLYSIQLGGSKPIQLDPSHVVVEVDGINATGYPVVPRGNEAHVVIISIPIGNFNAEELRNIRSNATTGISLHTNQGSISFSSYYLGE